MAGRAQEESCSCSSTEPCCPCSKFTARCLRSCSCKKKNALCTSCRPSILGRCQNQGSAAGGRVEQGAPQVRSCVLPEGTQRSQLSSSDDAGDSSGATNDFAALGSSDVDLFLREKFMLAFGAPLINDEGGVDSDLRKIWWRAVGLRGRQYTLPDGNVGTRFEIGRAHV